MFRLSEFLDTLYTGHIHRPRRPPRAPAVIWNIVRRCNLHCRHCYSGSADHDFPGELDTRQALAVIDDLAELGVPALILSGGEPLLRADLFTLAARAKAHGLYLGLSSNGTLVDEAQAERIAAAGFDYVGISIDGLAARHDRLRGRPGAFEAALAGLVRLKARGVKVGLRFTLTRENAADLPGVLHLLDVHALDKFYLSHLNFGGRGWRNRDIAAHHRLTRQALTLLFERAWDERRRGIRRHYVTGNNDADGVFLLHWAARRAPKHLEALHAHLRAWGGNASGVGIANIDNLGHVHPDSFWWDHRLGNVKERPFSAIWRDERDPLLAALRRRPRPLEGRCAACRYRELCNGNTRVRARRSTGNTWAADPGCYLTDREIGLTPLREPAPCA
ncbi:MAG: heme d1 biosynthesis radical SAM protein NirJ [Gammaproteobacteria bacterium]|nr:MAG: heme d1 biosynthesis radical SAM protein NirJ [Gammaproteobacteria bacterium]